MDENQHNTDETLDSCQPTADERLLIELARMADRRHSVACPDANTEWQRVTDRLTTGTSATNAEQAYNGGKSTVRRLKLWAMAATSAAAVLAAVLVYVSLSKIGADSDIIALDYDEAPQRITLTQDNGKPTYLSGKDSITYYNKATNTAAAHAKEQRLSTPRGMDFKLILPDGTEVWLNAESTIKFPSSFISGERRVELSGEAYFKVAHNAQKPFTVATGRMNIRVLGTEFNMRSYKSEVPRVTLIRGSVAVINPKNEQTECHLKPGQDAWRDSKGVLHVSQSDTYSVTQWVEGFFYFDDVPLITILRDLGRWYNLGVVFSNPAVANSKLHFSASRKDGIKDALSTISNITKTDISIEGTNIVVR